MSHQWRQVQPETDQGFSASASINVALSAVPCHMDGDIINKALLIWALMVCPPSVIFAWFYWHVAWDLYFSVLSLCARYLISFVSLSSRALHSARGPHPCASYQRPAEKSGPLRCLQRGGLQLPLLPQHLHWRRPRRCGAVLKTFCAAVLHHLEREFWCQVFYMWMLRHAGGPQTFTLLVFMWLQIAVRGRKRATSWSRSTAPPQSTSCPAAKSAPWCPSSHRIRTGRWEAAIAFAKSNKRSIIYHFPPQQQPMQCLKVLTMSGWNPPPGNRKMHGDLMYLYIVTVEERHVSLTASTRGFYLNQSVNMSTSYLCSH